MASKQVQLLDDVQDGGANKGVQRSSSGPPPPPPPEEGLRCPRCDSPNTKFCYYNNYSLTQPRHYCKACRRYWTRGGALRNVPVGGGCRKNKKSKSSSSSSSSTSSSAPRLGLDQLLYSSETSNRFKFFHGFSSEFNLPYRTSSSTGQLWSYGDQSTSISSVGINGASTARGSSLLDVNYLVGNFSETATNNTNSNSRLLTSTIESLSSINQDMHWKLQQQRLGMLYGGDQDHHHHNNKETTVVSDLPSTSYLQNQNQNQHLPISFHMPITSESFGFASGTTPTISNAAFVGDDNGISTSSDWYQKLQYL